MSKKDEALKLALDDLESIREILKRHEANYSNIDKAITAIKEALAEQGCDYCNHPQYAGAKCKNCEWEQSVQEPDMTNFKPLIERLRDLENNMGSAIYEDAQTCGEAANVIEKLRTSPPASKPWVGLNLDDHIELARSVAVNKYQIRAIEAKLREKNA